jgi:peptide/nickel transport system substrate-binding protein
VEDLAESYDVSEDGLTYTFRLIPGATFHDGSALTADDVVMSMNRHYQHPSYESAVAPFLEKWVESLEATDDTTVTLKLKAIRPDTLAVFANNNFAVLPTELIESFGGPSGEGQLTDETMTVGSGGFMFKEHQDEQFFEVERFPNYYRPDRIYLDGIRQLLSPTITDPTASISTASGSSFPRMSRCATLGFSPVKRTCIGGSATALPSSEKPSGRNPSAQRDRGKTA